jgi:inhibitor of KinA sporulation pathway (predicted exonuclease)
VTPEGQRNEIIEVGACLLDLTTLRVGQKRSLLVKPTLSTISPFCTELTTITSELVDAEGVTFAEACAALETEFNTPRRLWASWGSYDRRLFDEQCALMGVRYPFSRSHVNVKHLFGRYVSQRRPMPMQDAMAMLKLESEGTLHRGHDDAWNIAQILRVLLERHKVKALQKYWKPRPHLTPASNGGQPAG